MQQTRATWQSPEPTGEPKKQKGKSGKGESPRGPKIAQNKSAFQMQSAAAVSTNSQWEMKRGVGELTQMRRGVGCWQPRDRRQLGREEPREARKAKVTKAKVSLSPLSSKKTDKQWQPGRKVAEGLGCRLTASSWHPLGVGFQS